MADIKSQSNDSTEVSLRKAVDLLGNIEDKTNTLVVGELEINNTSGDPLSVQGTVTANVFGKNVNSSTLQQIPIIFYDEDITAASDQYVVPVQISSLNGSVGSGNPLPISGTVTANVFGKDATNPTVNAQIPVISWDESITGAGVSYVVPVQISNNDGTIGSNNPLPISGTVTAIDSALTGTITLINNTAVEIPNAGEYGSVVLEVVPSGVTFGSNNIVAQAHNQSGSATDVQIMSPIGIRVMHSADSAYGLTNTYEGSVGYVSLEPNFSFSGYYGTALHRYESNAGTQTSSLLTNRFFIFDISASRFFLKANFTAGTISVNYRLYRNKHPALSNRRVIATGDGSSGAVRVDGSVSLNGGSIYLDGGYLDSSVNAYVDGGTVNTYPQQGSTVTNTNFTSTTSATLVSAVANREVLTVHNEGPATLFINAGTSASTTSYQVRLLAGDYWEAPAGQQSLQHSGIFSSAGSTAKVTQIS